MIPPRTIVGVGRNPVRMAAGNETLKRHGFNVVTATSVPAALAACAGIHVDAVVIGRSIPQSSAQTLICRLRQNGGPPVMYLAESDNDNLRVSADQQEFLNQQFLRMLRTVLVSNRIDENTVDSMVRTGTLRMLRAWWLASLGTLGIAGIMVVADGDAGLGGIKFLVALAVCILCAVGCLRSQMRALDELRKYDDINAESWYPRIALGIAFLLPGILAEVGCFLLAMRKRRPMGSTP